VIEPSQCMFNHHKYISRMNTIVDKEWPNCVTKKDFETGSFFSQSLIFQTYKTYNHAIFMHLVLKLYKN